MLFFFLCHLGGLNLGSPGELSDCENTINLVFSKLTGEHWYCKVPVDEIHIKPAIRYQGPGRRDTYKTCYTVSWSW